MLFVVVLILASCSDQFNVENVTDAVLEPSADSDVSALMEKARWGDGEAYVKLADCYRDGKGVKQDFINMLAMVSFADEYGGASRMEDYISSLPEESEYRLVFDAMEKFCGNKQEEGFAMAEKLIERDCAEGYTVKGIILSEQGNREEGKHLLERAAEKGSGFAELYLCIPDLKTKQNTDIGRLTALAERMPLANASLAKIYTGKENPDLKNEQLAAYYYMKADENACLSKNGARWLLAYHRNGGNLKLGEKDIERLELLADSQKEEQVNIRHRDSVLETGIALHLEQDQEEYKMWSKAIVYVVETKTGKIKASVAYERKGDSFVPYKDTYNQEQSVMECGSTYLALLSTGFICHALRYEAGKILSYYNIERAFSAETPLQTVVLHPAELKAVFNSAIRYRYLLGSGNSYFLQASSNISVNCCKKADGIGEVKQIYIYNEPLLNDEGKPLHPEDSYLCAIDPYIGSGEHGFDILRPLEKETLLRNNQLVKIKDLFLKGIQEAPNKYTAGSSYPTYKLNDIEN